MAPNVLLSGAFTVAYFCTYEGFRGYSTRPSLSLISSGYKNCTATFITHFVL
jgi:hypothetical protein